MYFIGIIKGATKGYPVAYAQSFLATNPEKNSFKVIVTKERDSMNVERTIMSVLYALKPNMVRHIISSYSSSILGEEKTIARTIVGSREVEGIWVNDRETETVRRPKVIDVGMRHFGAIDLNDRYRQGYLNMEQSWKTQRLWVRVFTTVLGICFTDAYFAYNYERKQALVDDDEDNAKLHFNEFLGKLAYQLINNDFGVDHRVSESTRLQSTPNAASRLGIVPTLSSLNKTDFVMEKYDLTNESGRNSLRTYQLCCSTCYKVSTNANNDEIRTKFKTSYYCSACSDPSHGKFLCFCSQRTGRKCWQDHLETCHSINSPKEV
jgi:hypothetical protein